MLALQRPRRLGAGEHGLEKRAQQPAKAANTVQEAVRLANERKAALDECSQRMARIRGLTP